MDTKNKNQDTTLTAQFIKDFSSFLSYMMDNKGVSQLSNYDEMLNDARVSSLFYQRRNASLNVPFYIHETGARKVDDFVTSHLTERAIRKWGWELLTGALKYGHQPAEIVWQKEGAYYVIDYLKTHNIDQYSYDSSGQLHYADINGHHKLDQDNKWVIHRHEGSRRNNPKGESILRSAYWAYSFKQLGFQFWLSATEKFSVPSLVALFEAAKDPKKAGEVAEMVSSAIQDIQAGSGGAMAGVTDIKEIKMSGSVADFNTLVSACDVQIAYALTGQSLATNDPTSGSRALGEVHADTMAGVASNDAKGLLYTLQDLVSMVVRLNFGESVEVPEIRLVTNNTAPWETVASAIDKGIPISRKALYERYNLAPPEDEEDVFIKPEPSPMGGAMEMSPVPTDEDSKESDKPAVAVQLNGAQLSVALKIVESVASGKIPRGSGKYQLQQLFNFTEDVAEQMLGDAGKNLKPVEMADPVIPGKKKAHTVSLRRPVVVL